MGASGSAEKEISAVRKRGVEERNSKSEIRKVKREPRCRDSAGIPPLRAAKGEALRSG